MPCYKYRIYPHPTQELRLGKNLLALRPERMSTEGTLVPGGCQTLVFPYTYQNVKVAASG